MYIRTKALAGTALSMVYFAAAVPAAATTQYGSPVACERVSQWHYSTCMGHFQANETNCEQAAADAYCVCMNTEPACS